MEHPPHGLSVLSVVCWYTVDPFNQVSCICTVQYRCCSRVVVKEETGSRLSTHVLPARFLIQSNSVPIYVLHTVRYDSVVRSLGPLSRRINPGGFPCTRPRNPRRRSACLLMIFHIFSDPRSVRLQLAC